MPTVPSSIWPSTCWSRVLNPLVSTAVLALSAAVFVAGGIAVTMNAHGQISAAMKLPMECYYVCIPIGGALMILYSLNNLYHLFRDKDKEVA